jgi:hypothetical protein
MLYANSTHYDTTCREVEYRYMQCKSVCLEYPANVKIHTFRLKKIDRVIPMSSIYSKNPQLRPPSGLDKSGLNCVVVLIVDIHITAYKLNAKQYLAYMVTY